MAQLLEYLPPFEGLLPKWLVFVLLPSAISKRELLLTGTGLRCLRCQQSASLLLLRLHFEALHQRSCTGRPIVWPCIRHLDLPLSSGAHDRCVQHHLTCRVRPRHLDVRHCAGTLCGRACFWQCFSSGTVFEPADRGVFVCCVDADPAGGLPGCLNTTRDDSPNTCDHIRYASVPSQ